MAGRGLSHKKQEQGRVAGNPILAAYYEHRLDRLQEFIKDKPGVLDGTDVIDIPLCILASRDGRVDVLELLYNTGGLKHLEARTRHRLNALHIGVQHNQYASTKYLLRIGFDPNERLPDGQTLLHLACMTEDARFIKILLANGADANGEDAKGNLALHRACQEDEIEMAKLLIPNTEDLSKKGTGGKTPLHFAALSQSLELMKLLLDNQAEVRVYDNESKTPMDTVLSLGNQNLVAGLSDYLSLMVKGKVHTIEDLQEVPAFHTVLQILDAVDDDLENPVEGGHEFHDHSLVITEEDKKNIIKKIQGDQKMDYIEFKSLVQNIANNDLSDTILENHSVVALARRVAKHVLFREDQELLYLLMFGTKLWQKISVELEKNIEYLYEECSELGSTGMVGLLKKTVFDKEGKVDFQMMSKFFSVYANLTNIACEVHIPIDDDECKLPHSKFMRSPMETLALWSVLTGRFQLTENLLKGEQFDVLPLSLFCVALLRRLQNVRSIPRPTKRTMENVADKVESVCIKVLRQADLIDTTEKKMVSIHFLRQQLPVFGNRTVMDLAAIGKSEAFMVTNSVQSAVDREWYRHLFHVNTAYREFVTLLGIFPFNPLLYFLLEKVRQKYKLLENLGIEEEDEEDAVLMKHEGKRSIGQQEEEKTQPLDAVQEEDEEQPTEQDPADADDKSPIIKQGETSQQQTGQDDADGDPERAAKKERKKTSFLRNYFTVIGTFYTTPSTKFHYHIMAHISFICFFSYVMVANFEYHISPLEILVYFFVLGFLLEELHELSNAKRRGEVFVYITDGWNIIDWMGILLGVVGFSMRMVREIDHSVWIPSKNEFTDYYFWWTRFVLTCSCLIFWLRLLYVSTVMETLGPKLKMISVMITRDFFPFLIMLVIFMFGFGVVMHGLIFPNGFAMNNPAKKSAGEIFQSMFRITFYAMVGEFSLNLLEGVDCASKNKCPHPIGKTIVPHLIMVIYIVIVTILLLNLIVASFSKTVDEIDKKSFAMWQFERYDLLNEFRVRSPLPPPMSILGEVFRWLLLLVATCCKKEITFGTKPFSKQRIIKFLSLQAFALRGRRKHIVGELEVQDPEKLIPEIRRKIRTVEDKMNNIQKLLGMD